MRESSHSILLKWYYFNFWFHLIENCKQCIKLISCLTSLTSSSHCHWRYPLINEKFRCPFCFWEANQDVTKMIIMKPLYIRIKLPQYSIQYWMQTQFWAKMTDWLQILYTLWLYNRSVGVSSKKCLDILLMIIKEEICH